MLLIPVAADWLFHSKVTQTRAVDVDLDPEYASDFTKALVNFKTMKCAFFDVI